MGESRGITTWLREIRAGWPALVASILACCVLAAIATASQPSLYGAKGAVVLSPERFLQSEGTDALPALTENVVRLSSTEAVLIPASRAFAQAGEDVGEQRSRRRTATLSWLRDHIRVEKVGTSSVVEVTGKAPTQEAAIDLTRGAVESLTRFVRDTRGDAPGASGEPAPPSGLIILSAAESEGQVSPTPLRNFFVAINAGVLLGLVLALAFGRSRLRGDPRQVAAQLGVPLLAVERGRSGKDEAVTAARRLLEGLQKGHVGSLVVLLTGPADGDRIAHAAKRLGAAVCLATGKRALLVDADLGERAMSWQLRLADRPGLSDLMTSEVDLQDLEETIIPLYAGGMSVLPAGPPADGVSPIDSRRLSALVDQLGEAFDFVIVTGPSVDKTPELLPLVSAAHYCLMVTDGSISPQRLEAARVLRQDARPGAMGLISIRAPRRWLLQRS